MATNLINFPSINKGDHQEIVTGLDIQDNNFTSAQNLDPNLFSILDSYGPFPQYSLLIGVCKDGLPFMLGLDNPRSGSILVVGENEIEKAKILQSMSLSACLLNHPNQVSMCVITNRPEQYSQLQTFHHCQEILSPYDKSAGEMVIEFASISEQRRSGRERGAALMLIIDNYQSFEPMLADYSVYLNLKTLVAMGPKSGVWPLVSIEPGDVHTSKGQLLRSFGTYIFEKIEHNRDFTPANEFETYPDAHQETNFDVIVGGRLTPIRNLSV